MVSKKVGKTVLHWDQTLVDLMVAYLASSLAAKWVENSAFWKVPFEVVLWAGELDESLAAKMAA